MARASTKQGLKTTVHVLTGDYPLKEGIRGTPMNTARR